MTVAELLKAARERISTPERWTKRAEARTARGSSYATDPQAICWCVFGAVIREGGTSRFKGAATFFLERSLPADFKQRSDDPLQPIARFNDRRTTTHADVLGLFDRAIALAEQGAPS